MSEQTGNAPSLVRADTGSLVLTDISGYTEYLLGTELEHAQDVLSDLMAVVVGTLEPPLTVTKLEGDAIFAYALDGACGPSTLLDSIERSYFAFRSRQRDIAQATSCTCAACKQIPGLDLKFIVHHGSFVRRDLAGNEELTGRDVIVVHRLSKNSAAEVAGSKGYVLLTDDCMRALQLDGGALGMLPHVERYEDVGEIACHVEDLGRRWAEENERQRVYIGSEDAVFERTFTAPVDRMTAWEWLTAPERRALWQADAVTLVTPGGRQAQGVTNHCMHGPDVVVEHVSDWRPFDYVTKTYEFPGVGAMHLTFELTDGQGSTQVSFRGEALTGERLAAWEQISVEMLAGIDHMIDAYVSALQGVAHDGAQTPAPAQDS